MRILFVTASRIGDAVLTSGLLAHLIAQYPKSEITLAAGTVAAPLFTETPNVNRVIALAKIRGGGHWFKLWTKVVTRRWDLVVDLRASALSYFLWARERRIFRRPPDNMHRVQALAQLFSLSPPPSPRIWPAADAQARAARLVPAGGIVLAISPTANSQAKIWPKEKFSTLIAHLTEGEDALFPGARVAVFSAPDERSAALDVLHSVPADRRIDLAGTVDLLTAYACLERTNFFIGNDSGLMHLAAASGVPTLGLFGPSQEVHYAPWGNNAMSVRTDQSYEEIVNAPDFYFGIAQTRMQGLDVEKVATAAAKLWRHVKTAARDTQVSLR